MGHEHRARMVGEVRFAVIVTSDALSERRARGEEVVDEAGDLAVKLIVEGGFKVVYRDLVPNDPARIRLSVDRAIDAGADIVLVTGGTGLGPRDVSIDALAPLFSRRIPGFGELFRSLSYAEVGSAAMLSRCDAGVYRGSAVFVTPGSPHAVRLALAKLILPEARHLVAEMRGVAAGAHR
ncbi:molybdenum cofactor biosynthesis protein [Candidatus Geothermarchaeota archaeon ex4572_27]|nr:MAG: molybdenum cofactor biosynthesis protein [Candidatus Geothermarchaeota archaeon ex4572_27]